MKIIQVHNRQRGVGGQNVMCDAVGSLLARKGHQVVPFERSNEDIHGLSGKIRAFAGGTYSVSIKREFAALLRTEKPDLVHVHNLYPLISPSVLVASRQYGVPVVMRCANFRMVCPNYHHFRNGAICELCKDGSEFWCALTNCRGNVCESIGFALQNVFARKLRLFSRNVSYYLPPSAFVRCRLIAAGLPADRIVVLPNLVPIPAAAANPAAGSYVGFVGRFSPEKGLETLLAAARQADLPLRLAGDALPMGDTFLRTAPRQACFVGKLARDGLHEFYRHTRFLVVPSLCFESFGLAAAEAMAHGLPVIASRIGGLAEVVEDGVTGFLVEPGDVTALALAMQRLWNDPERCRQMGAAARDKALREYSSDVYYWRLLSVYEKAKDWCANGHLANIS